LQQSTQPEITDLALAIIEAQQREIDQLQAWRLAWRKTKTQKPAGATPGTDGHEC